jgi:hypothetical protein
VGKRRGPFFSAGWLFASLANFIASNSAFVGKRRGPDFLTAFLTSFLLLFFAGDGFVLFFAALFDLLAFLGARDTGTK